MVCAVAVLPAGRLAISETFAVALAVPAFAATFTV